MVTTTLAGEVNSSVALLLGPRPATHVAVDVALLLAYPIPSPSEFELGRVVQALPS